MDYIYNPSSHTYTTGAASTVPAPGPGDARFREAELPGLVQIVLTTRRQCEVFAEAEAFDL